MKLCSTLLVIRETRETQIEVTMRDYHTTTGMVNIKKPNHTKCWWTTGTIIHCSKKHKMVQPLWETGGSFLKFLHVEHTFSI